MNLETQVTIIVASIAIVLIILSIIWIAAVLKPPKKK